jgi:hypothetical protein
MRVESVLKQRDRMMEEAEARENVLKTELEEVRVCCERALARVRERERARERKGQRDSARAPSPPARGKRYVTSCNY